MQLKLFALLVLHANRAVSSDVLIDALWGPARTGAGNRLQMAVARLRKALAPLQVGEESVVRTVSGGYMLSIGPGELDADVFAAGVQEGRQALDAGEPARAAQLLHEALGLWRGPPLAEVGFEDFAQNEIHRLNELRLVALEARVDAELALGRHAQLVAELEGLLAEQPTRERAAWQLMLALYRCQRQAEALEVYQRTRTHLGQELGLEPGPALKALQTQILEQSPSLLITAAADGGGLADHAALPSVDINELPSPPTPRPTNLPVQPGPLLGRRAELAELLQLSATSWLVTLTGPGGSGKTRLALALASELSGDYQDGVWWVSLAAVTDPDLVLPTIARTLGARDDLREHLAGKRALLLLDNLEQVLDAAPLIADLLAGLPALSVIATSRERLAISFEQEYPVPPLDEAAAQELFVSRARQLQPTFEPDETVAEICQRLDRLPLALELAATRVKLLSTRQMLDRIQRRLDLLNQGRRDAPDRQATMRATIAWSYDLLPETDQALFRHLGVFAGSFELDAAEAVCDADLDGLQSLTDKSLLRHDERDRFFLLELTREYALEQLDAAAETDQLRRRHADWYLALAKRAEEHLASAEQGPWLARLHADTDNLRAVLAWCSERDPTAAINLAATLSTPWRMHGQLHESAAWLERALATPAAVDRGTRARGLTTLVEALWFTNQSDRLHEPLQEGLTLCRELGDKSGEATLLVFFGGTFWAQGFFAKAIELQQAALGISRDAGDLPGINRATNWLGAVYLDAGDADRSATMYTEAVAQSREAGDDDSLIADLTGLADAMLANGDHENAARHFREGLRIATDISDENAATYAVAGLACAAARRGDLHSAGRLWAVVEGAEKRLGVTLVADERKRFAHILTPLEGDQAFQTGYQAGREVDLAEAAREPRTS